MDCIKAKNLFISVFFLFSRLAIAGTVSGKITDENNEPIPYVSVYIAGTTQGATSNKDGIFSLDLPAGKHELDFKYIGYKTHTETFTIESAEQKVILNVKMEPQLYEIAEVAITANAEDPAYAVIRHAIDKRRYYLHQAEEYSCDIYIKGLQRMKNFPKKFMGYDVNAEGGIDTASGIFYLSESVEKYYFKDPDKVKEEMISSKVSGNSKAFSFNRASDILLNFYQNQVDLQVVSQRGFISPIAESALFYYKYHLLGTFYENGQMVNKIEVIPKREHDPVFRGIIYIMENSWRIHSTDLFLVKDAGLQFVDSLRINQIHLPVNHGSDVWEIFSNKLTFSFSIFAFRGNGIYASVHSNYNIDPHFDKNFFTAEEMKVEDKANKKDSLYWQAIRPVPLTAEEQKDYHKKDSVEVIHTSKKFLDSVDRKTNRFRPADVLFGYTHINRYKKREISFSPLVENIQFNTVQGLVAGSEMEIQKKYELEKRFYKTMGASYGFSDQRWNVHGKLLYEFSPKTFTHAAIEGGRQTVQFSEKKPISPLVNTIYTLLDENNYIKLYQKDYLKLSYNSELANGIYLRSFVEYSDRSPLMNTSGFILFPAAKNHGTYTSNDPLHPEQDSMPSFNPNQSLELRLNLRLRYKQKYISRPDDKWVEGSKYPTLHLEYRKGINSLLGSDVSYDFVKMSVTDNMNFKLLGKATYLISAGKFLNNKKMGLMDYAHFSGNKTILSDFDFSDFQLLDYYTYSTNNYFIEAHYEHDFGGFILNKLPLLRKLKVNELAGVHYLHTDKLSSYIEVFAGIEKLNFARIDFVASFSGNTTMTGIRLGLKIGGRN